MHVVDISQQCSGGAFLTEGRWRRLLLTKPCRSTFAAATVMPAPPTPNFAQNLTSPAKFWQPRLSSSSKLWVASVIWPLFLARLWKRYHMGLGWTGLVYGRQRERLLHFVHFDVGSVGFSGSEPISPFRFTFGVRAEEELGWKTAVCQSAPRGYWGTFLVFFFRIWQCMKLATKEATTRTPENRRGA